MSRPGTLRVGTSGWIYRHWRGPFYPPDLPQAGWFAHYSRTFDTVEVNNSFYRLPSAQVFAAWRRQAPPGFLYAIKASRFLTHMKKLKDPAEALERMLDRAAELGPRLGPILYQLPPRWHCDPDRLARFLAVLPPGLMHTVEFRDASWYTDEVRRLLEGAGAAFCIHDLRGLPCPLWVTGPFVYVRFHGPTQVAYAARYPDRQMQAWAGRIQGLIDSGLDVYAYFNNDDRAYAVENALQLRTLVGAAAPAGG